MKTKIINLIYAQPKSILVFYDNDNELLYLWKNQMDYFENPVEIKLVVYYSEIFDKDPIIKYKGKVITRGANSIEVFHIPKKYYFEIWALSPKKLIEIKKIGQNEIYDVISAY